MIIETTYTKEQVIELLCCNGNARRNWIIQKLEERYDTVKTVGRGKNIVFICSVDDNILNTPEGAYNAFKNILIDDYGFKSGFNYDAILKLIDFHIKNDKPISNGEIAQNIGISERAIYNYRKKLKTDILKDRKDCKKITMGRNIKTALDEDITQFYNKVIIPSYNAEMKKIHEIYFNKKDTEVAIFTNEDNHSYELVTREGHSFDFIKKNMEKVGNRHIATYPVIYTQGNRININGHLKQKIWELLIKEFGYMFVYDLRIYEIHEDLKNDKELLEFIKLAIQYSKQKEVMDFMDDIYEIA